MVLAFQLEKKRDFFEAIDAYVLCLRICDTKNSGARIDRTAAPSFTAAQQQHHAQLTGHFHQPRLQQQQFLQPGVAGSTRPGTVTGNDEMQVNLFSSFFVTYGELRGEIWLRVAVCRQQLGQEQQVSLLAEQMAGDESLTAATRANALCLKVRLPGGAFCSLSHVWS
jgi:hypothetical protein